MKITLYFHLYIAGFVLSFVLSFVRNLNFNNSLKVPLSFFSDTEDNSHADSVSR